jgi:pyruvate/2-oxoglutarate dehydrogenase complex dihydrolipoamide acyltransferase (E2) component
LVKVGDTVKAEQSLITVESDKASMEIPSSTAGVVKELRVKLGDKVKQGSVVLMLEAAGDVAAPAIAPAAVSAPVAAAVAAPAAVSSAVAPVATGPVEVHVPDIGDFKDVAVIEIFVKPGDAIKMEQSLITVESDKAAMEIPSSAAGILKELKVKIGDKVNIGDLLAILQDDGIAADQVNAADMRVKVDADARPFEARGHLLDMRRFARAVIALHHDTAVEGKACKNGERGIGIKDIRRIKIRHAFIRDRKGRAFHIHIDAEHIAHVHLGVGCGKDSRRAGLDVGHIGHELTRLLLRSREACP